MTWDDLLCPCCFLSDEAWKSISFFRLFFLFLCWVSEMARAAIFCAKIRWLVTPSLRRFFSCSAEWVSGLPFVGNRIQSLGRIVWLYQPNSISDLEILRVESWRETNRNAFPTRPVCSWILERNQESGILTAASVASDGLEQPREL